MSDITCGNAECVRRWTLEVAREAQLARLTEENARLRRDLAELAEMKRRDDPVWERLDALAHQTEALVGRLNTASDVVEVTDPDEKVRLVDELLASGAFDPSSDTASPAEPPVCDVCGGAGELSKVDRR